MLALTTLIQRAPHVTSNSSFRPTHDEYVYAMEKLNLNLKAKK